MSNYATKTDVDVDKLKTVPVDLSKLSNVLNKNVKKLSDKLVKKKVNNIDTSGFVLKTKYDTDKSNLEKKIVMQTKKFLMLEDLIKKQIIMLKLVKKKVKYLVLVV